MKSTKTRQRKYLKNPINRAKHWIRVEKYDTQHAEDRRERQRAYYARHREDILERLRTRYAKKTNKQKSTS